MDVTDLTVLGSTSYGVPSGNYDGSSMDFASDAAKGVAYYRGQGNIQTIGIAVTGFQGRIVIQATLDEEPDPAHWFDVFEYGDEFTVTTATYSQGTIGNFTWIRARVIGFAAGTIDLISVIY